MQTDTKQIEAKTWRYYSYDVWGNAEDGYDVNQVFKTSDTVELPDGLNDAELFAHLVQCGFLSGKDIKAELFETDHNVSCEDVIYFSYDGRPEGEFRLEA